MRELELELRELEVTAALLELLELEVMARLLELELRELEVTVTLLELLELEVAGTLLTGLELVAPTMP